MEVTFLAFEVYGVRYLTDNTLARAYSRATPSTAARKLLTRTRLGKKLPRSLEIQT